MVMVPPTLAAIARGINSLEADTFAAWQIPITTGIRQATVPVLEDTEDIAMVTSITAAIRRTSLVPAFLTTATPIASARPVLNIAAPMTNIPPNRTTVELDRPAYTCLAGRTPRIPRTVQAAIAVTASGISSVTNRNAATARTHSVIMAGSIIFTFLSDDSLTGFPTGAGGCSSKNVSGRFLETHIKLFDKNSLNRMNPEIISGKRLP